MKQSLSKDYSWVWEHICGTLVLWLGFVGKSAYWSSSALSRSILVDSQQKSVRPEVIWKYLWIQVKFWEISAKSKKSQFITDQRYELVSNSVSLMAVLKIDSIIRQRLGFSSSVWIFSSNNNWVGYCSSSRQSWICSCELVDCQLQIANCQFQLLNY